MKEMIKKDSILEIHKEGYTEITEKNTIFYQVQQLFLSTTGLQIHICSSGFSFVFKRTE